MTWRVTSGYNSLFEKLQEGSWLYKGRGKRLATGNMITRRHLVKTIDAVVLVVLSVTDLLFCCVSALPVTCLPECCTPPELLFML